MLDLGLRQRGSFTPRQLFARGEQGAWYDPSDLATLFQDSGGTIAAAVDAPVGRINDKSGRGNHAIQAAAGARPMLRRDGGGRHYLEGDGVDDWLRAQFAIAQPWDRVSAIRQISWTDFDRAFGSAAPAAVFAGLLRQAGAAPQIGIASGVAGPVTGALVLGVNAVVTERHHGAASRLAINQGSYVTGDAGTALPGGITLFSDHVPGNFGHYRLYGVCMVGRALSEAEIQRTRRFMAARAGIAI